MFKTFKIIPLVVVGFGFATIASAQVAGGGSGTRAAAVGAFDALSSGNKRIAEALFNGQIVTSNGKAPLSLDQIAAAKRRSGWDRIFRQLKADGLIEAKNLRELTSGRYEQGVAKRARNADGTRPATVVTTAAGRQIIVDKNSFVHEGGRNTGRDKNRRGSRSIGQHTESVFGGGSTYRGRNDNATQSGTAPSIGITSGNGVATSNIIVK